MNIVKAGHRHIPKDGLTPSQFIEIVGRTCYKSEDKITESSAEGFVRGLVRRGHTAMTEHLWVHLSFDGSWNTLKDQISDLMWNTLNVGGDEVDFFRFVQVTVLPDVVFISCPIRVITQLAEQLSGKKVPPLIRELVYTVQITYPNFFSEECLGFRMDEITTDLFRLWVYEDDFLNEMNRYDFSDLGDVSEECVEREIMKHMTHTVVFTCDRGVSHELVRHRPCSFAQESTRYCNYAGAKYGREITVIEPLFFENTTPENVEYDESEYSQWKLACEQAEKYYFKLIDMGAKPQEARSVLPNSLKTEVVMTCNETEWQHIVNLRSKGTTGAPHPQMVEIMTPWYEELKVLSDGRVK